MAYATVERIPPATYRVHVVGTERTKSRARPVATPATLIASPVIRISATAYPTPEVRRAPSTSRVVYAPIVTAVSAAHPRATVDTPGRSSDGNPITTTKIATHSPPDSTSERNITPPTAASSAPPPRASG